MSHTASHPVIVHTGTRYAIAWVRQNGGNHAIMMRLVDNDGRPVGAQLQTVFQQAAALATPHFLWNARYECFVLVWVDSRTSPTGALYSLRADVNGSSLDTPALHRHPSRCWLCGTLGRQLSAR